MPFPSCCDPDGDGFGSLDFTTLPWAAPPGGSIYDVRLLHGVGGTQVGTGDLPIARATIGGTKTAFPGTLQHVYKTVPALFSYSDGAGNSATPSYPGAPRAAGNRLNGFPVVDGPDRDSDIEVTLTFWRPQRNPSPARPAGGQTSATSSTPRISSGSATMAGRRQGRRARTAPTPRRIRT